MTHYNAKASFISGVANAAIHGFAHMHFANWSVQRALESNVTWVMGVVAFVATFILLTAKDDYHN